MTTNSPQSVHALVRLLKSPTDPPSIPGPSKIEIAHLAWSDSSLCAPNKCEVIGEWILTLFSQTRRTKREKDVSPSSDPFADSRYWVLLRAVLTTPAPTAARPIKTWLLPLLSRFQLDIIVIELLALQSPQVLSPARAALAVLWPLAETKVGVDALAECLGAVFKTCSNWERMDDDLAWICSVAVAAYRNALVNAGNKKRLYSSFLNKSLPSWLSSISRASPSSRKQLQDSIYVAGTDTLFSFDALKQPLDTLFDSLSSSISSLLPILPNIFASFLSATHKHRTVLFVAAITIVSGKGEVRKKGMEFTERCWNLIQGSENIQEDFEEDKWKSVIGVLKIVEKERLFVSNSVRGMHTHAAKDEPGGELVLSEMRDKAVEILEIIDASSEGNREGLVVLAVQLLDVLVQIEYDFVGSVLERILSALINIQPPQSHLVTTVSSEFLTRVLEYHTKTRTVHTYAITLLNALSATSTSLTSLAFASRLMASTFPLAFHLPALARALRTSLTPTQILPLASAVHQAVESAWGAFKVADEEAQRSAKKRRVTSDTDASGYEAKLVPVRAQVFSHTGRVSGAILSSLPMSAYAKDDEYSLEHLWADVGRSGWTIIWDCLRGGTREESYTPRSEDGKKRKYAVETDPLSTVHSHVVTSATLRLLYDVRARVSYPLGDCDSIGEAHVERLLDVMRDDASDPELVFEIIRTLLWCVWYTHNFECQKQLKTEQIFTAILDVFTARPLSGMEWSGVSAALTRDNLGLAVLYVLTERWIDLLDALASTEFLASFISLLLAYFDPLDQNAGGNFKEINERGHTVITSRSIFLNLLRNAQFWELHNIREVFLSSVSTLTAPLSTHCLSTTGLMSFPSSTISMPQYELIPMCNVYSLLHYVPPEYFTRPIRTELVKGAMAADVQICMKLEGPREQGSDKWRGPGMSNVGHSGNYCTEESDDRLPTEELQKWSFRLLSVRVFLRRTRQSLGTLDHSASLTFVSHLLNPPPLLSPSKALTTLTLELIQSCLLNFLRSQEPEAVASISKVISALIAARPFSSTESQETWAQLVVQSSVLKLIQCTTSNFDPPSLPDQVQRAFKTLLEALESALAPHAERLAEKDYRELDQFRSNKKINAWSCMLSLRRWLGINSQVTVVSFGLKLVTSTIRKESVARLSLETSSSVLGLLFEELWCAPDASHGVYLDILVAFYAVNNSDWDSDIERVMDAYIVQAVKKMTVEDFSHLLNILEEGIGKSRLCAGHLERLIHLGQVMLHDAPQGTLKVIQHFATGCFDLFANREEIHGGSSRLKLQYLDFIARHCSDRPAAIRSADLSSIWSLLNKILSGSSEHDPTTAFPIFHHIVTIIGALIRLRRDLVVHTLPHLGLVLRQLMMLTRKIRPQLGSKQSRMVTDTFPSWLSASKPLSIDEARALSRLLVSLTTKTVPRTHAYLSSESQKAESLAKPFAKHASYVLVAYVDAFNDPLCIINAEMRRDLEPGLFALCEMVGEYSRDALMVSTLNSGGKTIMKSLWKEYEKQRYVGKG